MKSICASLALLLCLTVVSSAGSIAIVQGSYYSTALRDQLIGAGETVTEITTAYTATSLSGYDAVIHYGNSYTNMGALDAYASGGGRLILTPWFWGNNPTTVPADLAIFTGTQTSVYSTTYPGVNVLATGDPLLYGVAFPAGAGGFNVGMEDNRTFGAGVTQVATWADGTAFIGYREVGNGIVIGINMHAITSDAASGVITQPWATQLFLNAVSPQDVPEPATVGLLGLGLAALALVRKIRA